MLKRDTKGKLAYTKRGFFKVSRYYRFYSGKNYTQREMNEDECHSLLRRQQHTPVVVMRATDSRKRWWMFKNDFYWEDECYSGTEMKALILERIRRREKRIRRAITYMELEKSEASTTRKPIPDNVKIFVWRRDSGRCVKCGSQKNLEYDHIIPISKGGSNTARNIQLLCETCNRSKGGNLV